MSPPARTCIQCGNPAEEKSAFCHVACKRAWKETRTEAKRWTRDLALAFCGPLAAWLADAGWGLALGGSILTRGASDKDLDLIVFPHSTSTKNLESLERVLIHAGLVKLFTAEEVQAFWAKRGSTDTKRVEVWAQGERRIDFFILS